MGETAISVVICTYNRCESLAATLEAFCTLSAPADLIWEILVVDNNSTDSTPEVCERFSERLPVRRLHFPKQGLSAARNWAIQQASADLVLFTDDDVDPDPDWLINILDAVTRRPDVCFFGGKVVSRWSKTPPSWFVENNEWIRSNPKVDLGSDALIIRSTGDAKLIGANLGFRRSVLPEGAAFREDIGPKGSDRKASTGVGGEEIEFQKSLITAGRIGLYVPNAIINHRDPPYRLTKAYLRRWYRESGRHDVRTGAYPDSIHRWFGAPRYLWREWLENSIKYYLTRLTKPSKVWLQAECFAARARGAILEFRSQVHGQERHES